MADYKYWIRQHESRKSERGAVTTLFIIITAGIILFGTILIDYARVAALNTITDQAVRGSVRSVLSAYDATLYERYGLFGRGGTPSADLFEKSIRGTLEYDGSGGSYRPVSPAVERFQVDASAFLGQYGVLKRQIEEEMKIKAPADFMLEIGTRFGAMSQLAKETATAANALATASKLYDERQRQLLRTITFTRDIAALASGPLAGDQAASLASGYSAYLGTKSNADALAKSIAAAESMAAPNTAASPGSNDQGVNVRGEAAQADPLEADRRSLRAYVVEMSQYESSLRAGAAELAKTADAARMRGQQLNQLASQSLEEAYRLNQAIRQAAAQAESNTAAGFDRVSGSDSMAEPDAADTYRVQDRRTIAEIRGSIGQLAFEDTWFESLRSLLEEQRNDMFSLTEAAYQFVHAVEPALSGDNGAGEVMKLASEHLLRMNQSFQSSYVSPGRRIADRESEINGTGASAAERNNNLRAAEASLNEAHGLLTVASVNASAHDALIGQYEEVHARYKANRLFNSEAEEAEDESSRQVNGANEQAIESVKLTGSLFDGLADMLDGISETFYTGEYVLNRFRSYAPQWAISVSDVSNEAGAAAVPSYAFADQEAEYVLYGLRSPFANVTAALTEIFALRFAIRLTEGFIECRAMSHPLLILSGALLYAAEHAAADMAELRQRGATKLSKYASVDIKYNDYLRLFMLLHGGGNKRLSRIAAVIETNTGTDLSKTPSAVAASADVSVNLLFLPGAMRLLGSFGLLDGRVANGRYETTKMAGLSYS